MFFVYNILLAANFNDMKSSRVSSGITGKNGLLNIKSNAERSDVSSSLMLKGKQDSFDDNKSSKNKAHNVQSSLKISAGSFATMPKGRHHNVDEGSCSKNDTANILSSDKNSHSSPALKLKGRHEITGDSSSSLISGGKPQSLNSSLNKMALGEGSGFLNNVNARGTRSQSEYKPEKWMLNDQAEDTLIQLNLAIVSQSLIPVL